MNGEKGGGGGGERDPELAPRRWALIKHFAILEPQNLPIDEFYVALNRCGSKSEKCSGSGPTIHWLEKRAGDWGNESAICVCKYRGVRKNDYGPSSSSSCYKKQFHLLSWPNQLAEKEPSKSYSYISGLSCNEQARSRCCRLNKLLLLPQVSPVRR